ncbi:tetratricopeptide repeat protein [Candidatus Oscillochloris fontis]|uniref:tetratricopeptide repeat protein n=1 Tax=Candidatus Oscillochloris fontis TaxID=2496868 RepID=UPI001375F764|nr:tetratricopeptide repeat protein [Candidatus Oscillochloris fontis]
MAKKRGIAFYRECCQPPLSQEALAKALGVSLNTISLWELNGVPKKANLLRLITFFVEQGVLTTYADAAHLWAEARGDKREPFPEPPELRALFDPRWKLPSDALPDHAPPPPGSLLLLRRNPLFMGREPLLLRIAQALNAPDATVAITGIAGIGKTQLATEFAHRYGALFPAGVFWISFADPNSVERTVADCYAHPSAALLPLSQRAERVLQTWHEPEPRLLIFDNCEDEDLLAQWRPAHGGSRVLLTSRRTRWNAALITARLPLPTFERSVSVGLLHAHLDAAGVAEVSAPAVDAVAQLLGDLPLALHLAGSYVAYRAPFFTLEQYLAELHAQSALDHPSLEGMGPSPTKHPQHLVQVLALAIAQLDPAQPVDAQASALLARAAHFAPGEPLLLELLLASANLRQDAAQPALKRLVGDLGLLEATASNTVRVHRLIAEFVRKSPHDPQVQADVERASLDLAQRFSDGGEAAPAGLLTHLRAVASAAQLRHDLGAVQLANALGWQLYLSRDFAASVEWLAWSRTTLQASAQPDPAMLCETLELLALAHQMYNEQTEQAEAYYSEALALCEQTYSPEHPRSADLANNLGYFIAFHRNDYDRAYHLLRHAVAVRRREYGLAQGNTARSLRNLGFAVFRQGRYRAAMRYLRLALRCFECAEGSFAIARAQTLMHMADVALACNDPRAEEYVSAMFDLREAERKAEDGEMAESYWYVARVALAQGNTAAATEAFTKAEQIYAQRAWPDHYVLARMRGDQARLALQQGNPAAAAAYIAQAQHHWEQISPDHADRAESYLITAYIALAQGDHAAARSHMLRAVAMREAVLGAEHPATRAARGNCSHFP